MVFRGFRVFEYILWQKKENPETPEINRKAFYIRMQHNMLYCSNNNKQTKTISTISN